MNYSNSKKLIKKESRAEKEKIKIEKNNISVKSTANNKTNSLIAKPNYSQTQQNNKSEVVVVDIKMPFWSMVVFIVKWVIASIPAFIILIIIGAIFTAVFGGIFGPRF